MITDCARIVLHFLTLLIFTCFAAIGIRLVCNDWHMLRQCGRMARDVDAHSTPLVEVIVCVAWGLMQRIILYDSSTSLVRPCYVQLSVPRRWLILFVHAVSAAPFQLCTHVLFAAEVHKWDHLAVMRTAQGDFCCARAHIAVDTTGPCCGL
jgi:hypothetical protein